MTCQAFVGGELYTGTTTGEVFAWQGNQIAKRIKVSDEKLTTLWAQGTQLYTGGADGVIRVWQVINATTLTLDQSYDCKTLSERFQATSVCNQGPKVLVGTVGGDILEFGVG